MVENPDQEKAEATHWVAPNAGCVLRTLNIPSEAQGSYSTMKYDVLSREP